MKCLKCGYENTTEAKFCSNCGNVLSNIDNHNEKIKDVLKDFDNILEEDNKREKETVSYQDYKPSFDEQLEKFNTNTKRQKLSLAENFFEITKGLHIIGTGSIAHSCALLLLGSFAGGTGLIKSVIAFAICFAVYRLAGKHIISLEDFREVVYDWWMNRVREDLPLNYSDYTKMVPKERKEAVGFFTILGYIVLGLFLLDGTLIMSAGFSFFAVILVGISFPGALITAIIAIVARRRLSISRKGEYK